MPAAGAMTLKLAGSGYFYSFAQTLMALLLRHLTIPLIEYAQNIASKRPFLMSFFSVLKI
jgi:hypothetical protein